MSAEDFAAGNYDESRTRLLDNPDLTDVELDAEEELRRTEAVSFRGVGHPTRADAADFHDLHVDDPRIEDLAPRPSTPFDRVAGIVTEHTDTGYVMRRLAVCWCTDGQHGVPVDPDDLMDVHDEAEQAGIIRHARRPGAHPVARRLVLAWEPWGAAS